MRASRNDWRFHGHGCCCRRHRMSQAVDTSARTTSIWLRTAPVPDMPALETDTVADVCVIGAGIAGLTTAYLLAREAKRVIVLDDGAIGSGETGRTTAHLSNEIDDRYVEIER